MSSPRAEAAGSSTRRHAGPAVAWALTFAVFVPLVLNAISAQRRAASLSDDLVRTEFLQHELRDLDEALTSTTRLAAAGVAPEEWQVAYTGQACRFARGLMRAADDIDSPALRDAVVALRDARDAKAAIEAKALEHVRDGDLAAARSATEGVAYREQLHQFAHAMQHFETAQLSDVLRAAETANARMQTTLWWAIVLFGSIVAVWGFLLRSSRSREALLRREIAARVRARDELERSTEQATALERQLHRAQRMESIGQLACAIAHEFANLGLVLSGAVARIRSAHPPESSPATVAALHSIDEVAEEARRRARSLACLSGKLPTERRTIDAADVTRRTSGLLARLLPDEIELEIDAPSRCDVHADPFEIEQVILNLALNGRNAMLEGGTLRIACCADAESGDRELVTIAVTDSGRGIEPHVLPHIFEPLFTTDTVRGTGLGLSIVARIVEDLRGAVDVQTRRGHGSTFVVRLPAVTGPTEATRAGRRATSLRVGIFAGPSSAAMLAREFEEAGHRPIDPGSGEDVDAVCVVGPDGRDRLAEWIDEERTRPDVRAVVIGSIDVPGTFRVHRLEGEPSLATIVRTLEHLHDGEAVPC